MRRPVEFSKKKNIVKGFIKIGFNFVFRKLDCWLLRTFLVKLFAAHSWQSWTDL